MCNLFGDKVKVNLGKSSVNIGCYEWREYTENSASVITLCERTFPYILILIYK